MSATLNTTAIYRGIEEFLLTFEAEYGYPINLYPHWTYIVKDIPDLYAFYRVIPGRSYRDSECIRRYEGVLSFDVRCKHDDSQELVSNVTECLLHKFSDIGTLPIRIDSLYGKSTFTVLRNEAGRPVMEGSVMRQNCRINYLIEVLITET